MSGNWGEDVAVPVWVVLSVVALIIISVVGRLFRPSYDGGGGLWRVVALVLFVVVAWRGFQYLEEAKVQAARSALAERVARAITAPLEGNPLLACTNGVTNAELRSACERTLFAKPENAAAAVALVKDRLDLLASASDPQSGLGADDPRRVRLRRALEVDDFGLVAHVLADSEQCRPDACASFALFKDVEKIRANMAARAFEGLVEKQAVIWSPGRAGPFGFKQRPELSVPPGSGASTVTSGAAEPVAAPPSPPLPAPEAAPPPPPPLAPTALSPPPPPVSLAPSRAEPPPPPRPVARPPAPKPQPPVATAPVQPVTPRLPPPRPLTPPPAPPPAPAEAEPSNPDN